MSQTAGPGGSAFTEPLVSGFAGVTTFHNDLARTGQNLDETILTPSNVTSSQFGKLFANPVDGAIYAQPLYLPNVSIPGQGVHNVVYVATENDSVYAFDADSPDMILWQVSFIDPGAGITTLSVSDVFNCPGISPEIGITGTPVIDPASGTLYVSAMTKESGLYFHRIHALDVTTGAEKFNGPIEVTGSVINSSNTTVSFTPQLANQRGALTFANGTLYITFASFCDIGPYHGWMMSYGVVNGTLTQLAVRNVTPDGTNGGIWQGGGGPAVDADGNLYLSIGNGTFDADTGGSDYGEAVIKLDTGLNVGSFFSPSTNHRYRLKTPISVRPACWCCRISPSRHRTWR